ncbi:universal stress protein [Nocardia terpenica]|uniref:Universal stress protein n=2 Tax=Nocardia terpenica TaxID=455432 RepID=A0A6G9ZH34_9NOCA|nr:universal stress protein [Nocardia terpenica]
MHTPSDGAHNATSDSNSLNDTHPRVIRAADHRDRDPYRQNPYRVVVGVDDCQAAHLAVRWAIDVAAQRGRELRIVHGLDLDLAPEVADNYDTLVPAVIDTIRQRGIQTVATFRQLALHANPNLQVSTEISPASPARLLLRYSATGHLVVLGATGGNDQHTHVGSTVYSVTGHAGGITVVVPDTGVMQQPHHTGPVVVGVDGSTGSAAAIAAAIEHAAHCHTELVVVHAWSDLCFARFAGQPEELITDMNDIARAAHTTSAEQLAIWQEKNSDVSVDRRVYLSGPSAHLLEWSKSAQLVVVGNRGRGGFAGLSLGSTSNFLVQHAQCPVMVVHAGG